MDLVIETFNLWQGSQCSFSEGILSLWVLVFCGGFFICACLDKCDGLPFCIVCLGLIHSEEEGPLSRR